MRRISIFVLITLSASAAQAAPQVYQYTAHGTRVHGSPIERDTTVQYTGKYQDNDLSPDDGSGPVYLSARYLSPNTAQFMSPDSIVAHVDSIGLNPYAYCNGNPITSTDPTGHEENASTSSSSFFSRVWSAGSALLQLNSLDQRMQALAPNIVAGALFNANSPLTSYATDQYAQAMRQTDNNAVIAGNDPAAAATAAAGMGLLRIGLGYGTYRLMDLLNRSSGAITGAASGVLLPNPGHEFPQQYSPEYGCGAACVQYLIGNGPGAGGYISQSAIMHEYNAISPDGIPAHQGGMVTDILPLILQSHTGQNYQLAADPQRLTSFQTPFYLSADTGTYLSHSIIVLSIDHGTGTARIGDPQDGTITSAPVATLASIARNVISILPW